MNSKPLREYSVLDKAILFLDKNARHLAHCVEEKKQNLKPSKPNKPYQKPEPYTEIALTESEKKESIALMRINHTGEICAQALYQAQALTAKNPKLRRQFRQAAKEELNHLIWCRKRLQELNGRTSLFNPIWYLGSFGIGIVAGLFGDKASLGFLAETEHQVVEHLQRHLDQISPNDAKSRKILKKMQEDELSHQTHALEEGGIELPHFIRKLMTLSSKMMTMTTKYI